MPAPAPVRSQKKSKHAMLRYVWRNPGTVIDRSGLPVNTTQERWQLNEVTRPASVNWNLIETATDIKDSMKAYVAHSIESQAPLTAFRIFEDLRHFLCVAGPLPSLRDVTYLVLEQAMTEMRSGGTAARFCSTRQWYRWCVAQDVAGMHEEILNRLDEIRIPILVAGQAVMSRDPRKGPLDDQEHWLVRQAVKSGKGTLLERVCVMLVLELGSRPSQLVLLKEQDYRVHNTASGDSF
ncbi:MAG: hypothetical protein L0387_36970, partial [Acidobacteria bacterium]|nr:hypothetical protein [Acidobacteriota bacterium]